MADTYKTVKRDATLDIAKGIAILLVVFGHCISAGPSKTIIYAFHVPAFFIVSGIIYGKNKNIKPLKLPSWRKVASFMIPYFVFELLMCFAVYAKGGWYSFLADDGLRVNSYSYFQQIFLFFVCEKKRIC